MHAAQGCARARVLDRRLSPWKFESTWCAHIELAFYVLSPWCMCRLAGRAAWRAGKRCCAARQRRHGTGSRWRGNPCRQRRQGSGGSRGCSGSRTAVLRSSSEQKWLPPCLLCIKPFCNAATVYKLMCLDATSMGHAGMVQRCREGGGEGSHPESRGARGSQQIVPSGNASGIRGRVAESGQN